MRTARRDSEHPYVAKTASIAIIFKITKVILPTITLPGQWPNVNVVGLSSFVIVLLFSMYYSLHVAVNMCINCSFLFSYLLFVFYNRSC